MNVMEPELKGIILSTEAGFLQLLIFYITRYIHEGCSMAIISSGSRFVEAQYYQFEMLSGKPVLAKHIPVIKALTTVHLCNFDSFNWSATFTN
jgi:hypothetical protein